MKVRWKKAARRDLREIRAYIARNSPNNAARFISRIVDFTGRLDVLPNSGSPLYEFPSLGFREIFVDHYRIIYIVQKYVSILRVIRGDRLLQLSDLEAP